MTSFHNFTLGGFNCTTFNDIVGEWDVWTLFPSMPRDETEALLDQLNMSAAWPRQGNLLLVDTGTKKVLIDTGLPTARNGRLIANLAAAGLTPDDIDVVFITHGDGDHVGGLSNFNKSEIIMPQASYQLWTEEEDGMVEEFVTLFRKTHTAAELAGMEKGRRVYPQQLRSLQERLTLAEPDREFLPGFRFIPAPGHRRDHVAVEIRSAGATLLHVADAFRHPIDCVRHDYYSLFDSYPDQLAESARMLMTHAADNHALVFGAHIPFPALIQIERDGDMFRWVDLD